MRTVTAPSSSTSSARYYGRETKFQKVRLELEMLANRLGPGQKLPSIRELAATMGASISTLSGALEEMEKQNLVCRHHGKGIFVMPSRPRTIWLLCDAYFFASGHSPFWDVLVEQARVRALVHNEVLSLHFTLPSEGASSALHPAMVREIQEGRVHGIVGVGVDRDTALWFQEQDVAYTAFAGWAPYMIRLHDEEIVRQGVRALAAQGCRRIVLWQNARPDLSDIFEAALRECGLASDSGQITPNLEREKWPLHATKTETSPQLGYRTALEAFELDRSEWPDGIVSTDDMVTQGALAAMSRLGVLPGKDVRIATHANKGTTIFLGDPQGIVRIEYDPAEVVQRLFDILEALMKHEVPAGVQPYGTGTHIYSIEPRTVWSDEQ